MKTAKEQLIERVQAQVNIVIGYFIDADQGLLLEKVVADGPFLWRQRFCRSFKGGKDFPLAQLADLADSVFGLFCKVHIARYQGMTAGQVLDSVEERTPPTAKEIADAWEIDSGSSEEGRKHFYGEDGRPEELIKQLRTVH